MMTIGWIDRSRSGYTVVESASGCDGVGAGRILNKGHETCIVAHCPPVHLAWESRGLSEMPPSGLHQQIQRQRRLVHLPPRPSLVRTRLDTVRELIALDFLSPLASLAEKLVRLAVEQRAFLGIAKLVGAVLLLARCGFPGFERPFRTGLYERC